MLALLLGSQAPVMRQFANGIDERPLIPAREPQKSFSQQETFNEDVTDEEYVEATLRRMADHLFAMVREEGRSVRTLTVRVRYNDRDENTRAESLREPTDLETDIYGRLQGLLREAWQRRVSLRMVSLKLSNVYDGVPRIKAWQQDGEICELVRSLTGRSKVRWKDSIKAVLEKPDCLCKNVCGPSRSSVTDNAPTRV